MRHIFDRIEIIEPAVPDGVSGVWAVSSFEITQRQSEFSLMRAYQHPMEYVPPGKYRHLTRDRRTIMSNTPFEIHTNAPIIRAGRGRVLINGLGLGVVLTALQKKMDVDEVWVVEQSTDVIALVWPSFAADSRMRLCHSDALTFMPPKRMKFDAVWHDIWDDVSTENLPQMVALHRKYGRRAAWQGSWARDLIGRF